MGDSEVEVIFTPWPYDAVARGVALLDEKVPGWRERMRISTIRMEDCERCLLGQIFGDFTKGLNELGLALKSDQYGFELPDYLPMRMSDAEGYRALANAWRETIAGAR